MAVESNGSRAGPLTIEEAYHQARGKTRKILNQYRDPADRANEESERYHAALHQVDRIEREYELTHDVMIPLRILGFKPSERPSRRELERAYDEGNSRRHPLLRKKAYETLLHELWLRET